ncbi:MAG: triphosphoribosyl-dephospho-CoA synthase CitG [Oscillospiraceae bacterium]|nr:triphosphoribosyl-dephospho-CoA synthase CitG [Oscillospiraceae bacterium]
MNENLTEILNAREKRAEKQKALLAQYNKPLICFTMNIPGPIKWSRDIAIGFFLGNRMLKDTLPGRRVLYYSQAVTPAGGEAYYVVDMPAKALKKLAVDIEDSHISCRLFDMDVLDIDGRKLSRKENLQMDSRTCLLCEEDAAVCARSRAHSLEQLQDRTGFLLFVAARELLAEYIGAQAYLALQKEVQATPKPGLVDRVNRGAHKDMDMRHFFVSANALRPYFVAFADAGYLTRDDAPEATFGAIRPIGIDAEKAMLSATGGVNTHKGAIFSLGLLCAAAGRLSPESWQTEALLKECAAMTKGLVNNDFSHVTAESAATFGEKLYVQHGITGVRGQAEAGFPAVLNAGLPIFQKARAEGRSENDALCITLLHLITATDDTNLIHRSDLQTQQQIRQKIADLLKDNPFPEISVIQKLDMEFIEKNLSPGGSADLLALTYLLHTLTRA